MVTLPHKPTGLILRHKGPAWTGSARDNFTTAFTNAWACAGFPACAGEARALDPGAAQSRRPSLIGYLNVIYPNKIQIVGTEELNFLDGLDSRQRWEVIHKVAAYQPVALIVTKDQTIPSDLREVAEETNTPLWISPKRGHELLTYLQYHLARCWRRRPPCTACFWKCFRSAC
jgi:HPr kinase/phosphorylase